MAELKFKLQRKILFLVICVLAWHIPSPGVFAAAFIPEQPMVSAEKLRPGMVGHILTVLKGTKPVKLPMEIVSVIPQKGSVKHLIMIRLLPSKENKVGGVAQGMSGSPVYVNEKLAGAVSMGWNFSDHTMAMVTPIEDMCRVFSNPDNPRVPMSLSGARLDRAGDGAVRRASPLMVSGLSGRAVTGLQAALGVPLEAAPYGTNGELPLDGSHFSPGDAAAVFLVWGDVEMSAVGTVTATSKDGRFLAFGHSFLERGAVNFPIARAKVHDTIFSQAFPFKIASPVAMIGTVTQDRASGVGGRMGYFTSSIAATLVLKDMDVGGEVVKNFRVVPDAFLSAKLLEGIYSGLLDEQWGRKGEGTATVTLRVDGRDLTKGWTRTNVFFSDVDVGSAAVKESAAMIEMIMLQPFKDVYPIGFRLDVSVTREPKVLYIEDVVVSADSAPGDTLSVEVTLRPWRRDPIKRHFEVTIPKEATGSCELVVRGGGTNALSQVALEGGWKSIDGFERLLTEINAADANNELILELLHDQADSKTKSNGKKIPAELIQEEK